MIVPDDLVKVPSEGATLWVSPWAYDRLLKTVTGEAWTLKIGDYLVAKDDVKPTALLTARRGLLVHQGSIVSHIVMSGSSGAPSE